METLHALRLPPGLYRNGTTYGAKNRWFKANLVRWHEGVIRPIGGWELAQTTAETDVQVTGKPRATLAWRTNDSTPWLAVGTTGSPSKLYAFSNGTLTDITPVGLISGQADGFVVTGLDGWGEGGWGDGGWGGALPEGSIIDADTWSLDNFGEILLACLTSDGKIYESTPPAVATQVTNSPTARAVVVTPERFVMALGASGDPRNVAWCAQSNRTLWTPAASNSAGSFPLQTVGRLVAGRRTDRETLLWTDADLWSAVYVGGNLVYAFQRRGDACGLISPNAVTIAESAAYWMGNGKFFRYDGAVRPIPCEVSDYVFGDLDRTQKAKIAAVPNPEFDEVTWYYPSSTQTGVENDRYVTLNYRQGFWITGDLNRACGVGSGVFANPQLWDTDGTLYQHEIGMDHDGEQPFLESGPLELGDGDRVLRIQTLIPDEKTLGQVQAFFYSAFQPMSTETLSNAYTLSARTNIRISGRQFRIRLVSVSSADFRIGAFRVGYVAGGFR